MPMVIIQRHSPAQNITSKATHLYHICTHICTYCTSVTHTEKYFLIHVKLTRISFHHIPIYLDPNGTLFGSKSIGKYNTRINFI